MRPNPQFPADLVTFTEEILSGKLHFLCSGKSLQTLCKLCLSTRFHTRKLGETSIFYTMGLVTIILEIGENI